VKKYLLLLFFDLIFIQFSFAQKENNIATFGNHAGFDFSTFPPRGIDTSAIQSVDNHYVYSSSISDKYGYLMFYTDGFTTWNRKNQPMKKFQYRWPWTGFVMPLICPVPGNDSLYYIFGVSEGSYANRLQCVTINMKGDNGLGEIVYPTPPVNSTNYYQLLLENASVFVAGTAHCNRRDTWIVTFAQNAFYSFLVTPGGINPSPIISPVANSVAEGNYMGCNLKFSPAGERIVMPLIKENKVVVLEFDNLSGKFSNPIKIDLPENKNLKDVEISPDGNKLYVAVVEYEDLPDEGKEFHSVAQMNLKNWNKNDIEKSFFDFDGSFPVTANYCTPHNCYLLDRSMELGPDGRIYISMKTITETTRDKSVTVIEEPNEEGLNARYSKNLFSLKRQYQYIRFNYIRSLSFTPKKNGIQFKKNICAGQPVNFGLLLNKVDSVKWDFGDSTFSTEIHPLHAFPAAGKYQVKAVIYNNCFTDTATAEVTITTDKRVKIPETIKDSVICTGTTLFMDATTSGAKTYLWGGGNNQPIQKIAVSGMYQIEVRNECSIDRKSFKVTIEDCNCEIFIPNAFTPNNDGLNDFFKPTVKCLAADFQFRVFNRYGQKVFETMDKKDKGWSGKIKQEPAANGTYTWTLQYRNPNTKKMISQRGTVFLIR
jgi:gliding motility-associated-like protein